MNNYSTISEVNNIICNNNNKNISEKDISEKDIIESNLKRLETVLHSARLGIWDWYLQSNSVLFNQDWKSMIGYQMNELPDELSTWENIIHPDDKEETMIILEKHVKGETDYYTSEHRIRHKNGHYIWVLDTGKVVEYDKKNNPTRATGIHQDITKRKTLEIELIEANQSKDMFMASISHEFKNILNSIILPVQLLKMSISNPDELDDLNTIHNSANLLSSMINDILDFTKHQNNKMDLHLENVNLMDIIRDILQLLRPEAQNKNINMKIENNTNDDFLEIIIDSSRIKQVFINLISNAIKYNKKNGFIHIKITKDLFNYKILIMDNGVGMSEDFQKKLFKPFERDPIHSKLFKGNGLGLSIAKKIITYLTVVKLNFRK